jgi:uncharacterized membrane protein YkvA (DUF1232 family)
MTDANSGAEGPFARWRRRARLLKRDTYAIYLAFRDPRVPWDARALALCVVAYAFSPLDLIPDFIPVLGYVDDLLLVPLGIALVLRLIPPAVLAESRQRASEILARDGDPAGRRAAWGAARVVAVIVVAIWLALAALAAALLPRALRGG